MKTKFNQSKLKLAIVSAIMACSAGLSTSSYAATTTATMTVSSSVLTACTMTTGDLAFGTYDPTGANVDGTATIASTCTLGGAATITLGQGTNADTGSTDEAPLRQMADGTKRLKYHLYGDNDRAGVFGNTTGTGQATTGTGSAFTTTVYGRILSTENTTTPPGNYSDSVLVTLTY